MNICPPEGSKISLAKNTVKPTLCIPQEKSSPFRFLIGLFFVFWMGCWFLGFFSTIKSLMEKIELHQVLWLGGWTIGGLYAGLIIYKLFRPSRPEKYTMNPSSLIFDSGIRPFQMDSWFDFYEFMWKDMFIKRKTIEFTPSEIRTITLRRTYLGNRVTIDKGTDRIDLANNANEIEKEWLYKVIKDYYCERGL